jgi:invasion protein IalB
MIRILRNLQDPAQPRYWVIAILYGVLLALPGLTAAESGSQAGVKYQDWTRRCEPIGETEKAICYISQNLVLRESGQRLLNIAVGYLEPATPKQPRGVITFPLGISLPPGITVQIDQGQTRQFPIERCNKNGCIAAFTVSDELLAAMKAGLQARITFHDAKRKAIGVPVSLRGFTAGFNSLQ